MPITGVYTWEENDDTLVLKVPLKGVVRTSVDVFVSEVFVKVNYAPYLLMVDLAGGVDDLASKAVFANGELVLSLTKKTPGIWGRVEIDKQTLSKAQLRARREEAVESKRAKEQALDEQKKKARYNAEQLSMKKEWALVDAEKKHIEDLKEEEKTQAEEDVYRALARVQAETEAKERKLAAKMKKKQKKVFEGQDAVGSSAPERPSPAAAARARKAAAAAAKSKQRATPDDDDGAADGGVLESKQSAPPSSAADEVVHAAASRAAAAKQERQSAIFADVDDGSDGDESDDEESDDDDVVYVPPPRQAAKVTMNFTERIFPTPLRESKVAQEEDWIAKNKVALDKRRKKLNPDARDISERDPVWLKGKADDFYRSGDVRAAANAYTSAIDADPSVASCYSNRAACFLALGDLNRCVEDCGTALEMLPAPADVARAVTAPQPDPDQVRWHKLVFKVLVRRGTALCKLGKYEAALADYTMASQMKPGEESVAADVQRIQNLIKCAGLKKLGDDAYRGGDKATAVKHYTAALDFDPSFVSALSNRAACLLATGDYARCVEDCCTALRLMDSDHPADPSTVPGAGDGGGKGKGKGKKAIASGPVPEPGTDRYNAWLLKTLVRRGAALTRLARFEDARLDYERAVVLDPSNKDLLRDLARLRARCKAVAPTTNGDDAEGGAEGNNTTPATSDASQ